MVIEADWWLSRIDMGKENRLKSGTTGHLAVMEMFYIMMGCGNQEATGTCQNSLKFFLKLVAFSMSKLYVNKLIKKKKTNEELTCQHKLFSLLRNESENMYYFFISLTILSCTCLLIEENTKEVRKCRRAKNTKLYFYQSV